MLLSLRKTEEQTYLVRPKSSQWSAIPLRAVCASKLNRAMAIPWLREQVAQPSMVCSLHPNSLPSQNRVTLLTVPPGNSPGWSLLWTTLRLCLGKCYLRQGKAMPWSILTSRTDGRTPVLDFGSGPFWFAGIDEVDGISMVGTSSLCSLWVSYFLRQSRTQIFSFSFFWNDLYI